MSKTDFDSVIKPKVNGSWNLHKHLPRDVDFFVLLSSIGGMTGSRGQTNYAAGNTYQDALARHRVSQGLKCISLDLGSVLSVGFAAEKNLSEILEAGGFQGIRKQELLALLDWACDPSLPLPTPLNSQVVTGLGGVVDLTADRLKEVYWTRKPLFSILRQMKTVDASSSLTSTSQETAVDYPALLRSAHTPAAAEDIVIQGLVQKLSKALSIPIEDIEVQKPIHAFGVDSLVALEVRYWFMKEMKADLTVFDIMSSANLLGLSRVAVRKSECCQEIEQVVGKEGK